MLITISKQKVGVTKLVFNYKHLKLKLRVSSTGDTVIMVTCYVITMTMNCSVMTGHLVDTIIILNI